MSESDSQPDVNALKELYKDELDRLRRLLKNMHSVSDIRYNYNYLSNLRVENSHEFIMHVEAVTTGLVVSYGRLFTESNGTTKLNEKNIPKHLRSVHDEVMSLRNKRYAHHGAHDSIDAKIEIEFDGTTVTLIPQMHFVVCFGIPKHWAPLFEWLDGFIYETMMKQIDHLNEKSGIEWKIPFGAPPYWITDQDNKE